MGPAPAVAEIRRAVREVLRAEPTPVLVACSGGADSLALAAAVAFEAPRAGVRGGLVSIDHGLQPGSAQRARDVAALGHELGLDPVVVVPVEVGTHGGPEGAARTARYAALDATAAALDALILLGHTRDDQAETVLLGLARGSGPRSVAGMRAATGRYRRPLLELPRATTRAACAELGLAVWDDPHNADPRFRRVRVRAEVLPLLDDVLAGGVGAALARTAALLHDDLDALDAWAAQVLDAFAAAVVTNDGPESTTPAAKATGTALDADVLAGLPRAVRTRVLRRWAARAGAGPLTAERTAALDALVVAWRGQGPIDLPGGLHVRRVGRQLRVAASARIPACPNSTPTSKRP